MKTCERFLRCFSVWCGAAWLQRAAKFSNSAARHLRRQAEETLGEKFDLREFHDVVLRNGAIPLSALEGEVKAYINEKQNLAN